MSRKNAKYDYESWTYQGERLKNAQYVGATGGTPVFYDPSSESIFEGVPDETNEAITMKSNSVSQLDPGESLGEAIERVGEELGWDSLSEFAREHLESDEDET